MKKILFLLTLTIATSMANTENANKLTSIQSMGVLTNNQTIIREVRSSRKIRPNRKIRAKRVIKIKNITSFPIARNSREVRKNRFITQRVSRKIRHVFIQENSYIARLK